MSPRTRVGAIGSIVATVGIAALSIALPLHSLQDPGALLALEPGVGRPIAKGEVDRYRLPLLADQLVAIELDQLGADVGMRLYAPDGRYLFGTDSWHWEAGVERLMWIAPEPGEYRLEIRCWNHLEPARSAADVGARASAAVDARPAGYRLSKVSMRTPSPRDRLLASASTALDRAWTETDDTEGRPDCATALELFRQAGDPYGAAEALFCLGRELEKTAPARAVELFEEGARVEGARPFQRGYGLRKAGVVRDLQGRPEDAATLFEEALAIATKGGSAFASERAFVEQSLGVVLHRLGELGRGIRLLDESIAGWRRGGHSGYEVKALRYRGALRYDASEYDLALDDLDAALSKNALDDLRGRAETLTYMATAHLGRARQSLGNEAGRDPATGYRAAIDLLEQAVLLYQKLDDPVEQSLCETEIGLATSGLGDDRAAIVWQERALARLQSAPVPAETRRTKVALVRRNLALSLDRTGRSREALALYRSSLTDLEESRPLYSANTRADMARALWRLGDLDQAQRLLFAAIEGVEARRVSAEDWHARASFFDSVLSRYDLLVRVLIDLDRQEPGRGFAAQAFAVHERSRARTLLDRLASAQDRALADSRKSRGSGPRRVDEHRTGLEEELRRLQGRRIADAAGPQNRRAVFVADNDAIEREIRSRLRDLRSLESRRDSAPRPNSGPRTSQLATVERVQQRLERGEALIEFHLGADAALLWTITPDALAVHELDWSSRSARVLDRASTLLASSDGGATDWGPASALRLTLDELARTLQIARVQDLGASRLIVVADGNLRSFPIGALPILGTETFLGHRFAITAAPSASAWLALRERGRQPAGVARLGIVADPVTVLGSRATGSTIRGDHADRRHGEPPVTAPRLEGAALEAERLAALLPKARVTVLSDYDANRMQVLTLDLSHFRFLHFAVHGLVDHRYPELNSLLLSTFNREGVAIDGLLTAMDFDSLRLSAEVVSLGACSSALGERLRGEGILGLTQPILVSGARSVLASLWPVEDRATAELMIRFYREVLSGVAPAEALRVAGSDLARQSRWSSPRFWAAFVLYGS